MDRAVEPGWEPGEPGEPGWARPGGALGARGLLALAVASGAAVWATWAVLLMPGFRRVPLRLQVPFQPSSPRQVANSLALLRGRAGKTVDLGSGDGRLVLEAYRQGLRPALGYELNPWLLCLANYRAWKAGYHGKVSFLKKDLWKVNLSDCHNVIVFLAPSVVQHNQLWEEKHFGMTEISQQQLPASKYVQSSATKSLPTEDEHPVLRGFFQLHFYVILVSKQLRDKRRGR